jgi:precorrin-2 dehydrogenase / sirohydrochlorin ferrochelatase
MAYYPVSLQLESQRVLVIGGGRVALQKIPALLASGARVSVVAPTILPEIRALRSRRLRCATRGYRLSDLNAARLVIAATDNAALQKKIAAACRARHLWVNVADAPGAGNVILPASLRRGDITVAVSTGGAAPALAKHLRRKLSGALGKEYAQLATLLRKVRPDVLKWSSRKRKAFWNRVASDSFVNTLRRDSERARRHLKEWVYGNRPL